MEEQERRAAERVDARPSASSTRPPGDPSLPMTLLDAQPALGSRPIEHAFPAEQEVHTPVPVYFASPAGEPVARAKLLYRQFGDREYLTLAMERLGAGFAAVIPCDHVTTTGDLRFYVALTGPSGEPLEGLGSSREPLRISIKNEIAGGPPSLPGKAPPVRCPDARPR